MLDTPITDAELAQCEATGVAWCNETTFAKILAEVRRLREENHAVHFEAGRMAGQVSQLQARVRELEKKNADLDTELELLVDRIANGEYINEYRARVRELEAALERISEYDTDRVNIGYEAREIARAALGERKA